MIVRYGNQLLSDGGKLATLPPKEAPSGYFKLYEFDEDLFPSGGSETTYNWTAVGSIDYVDGKIRDKKAVEFDQTGALNSYATSPIAKIWSNDGTWPNSDMSVSFWYNFEDVACNIIWQYYTSTYDSSHILSTDATGSLLLNCWYEDGWDDQSCYGQLETGWNHIVIIRDNWDWLMYVNNEFQSDLTFNHGMSATDIQLGYNGGATYGGGAIQQMYWYLDVLTESQISDLYNYGLGV